MSPPSIPNPWTINTNSQIHGSLDLGLDDIHIKEIPAITLHTDSSLTSNSTVDMGLAVRIKELPPIDLNVQLAMKPTRIHFPTDLKFGLCVMGRELLAVCICGESMVVIEDYVPHRTERCL